MATKMAINLIPGDVIKNKSGHTFAVLSNEFDGLGNSVVTVNYKTSQRIITCAPSTIVEVK